MDKIVVCSVDPNGNDPFAVGLRVGLKTGRKIGMEEGKLRMLIELLEDKKVSLEYAAKRMDMTAEEFLEIKLALNGEMN